MVLAALKTGFPPTVDAETRLLLLGSLPGDRSLEARQYYAHSSNAFWWLMGEVLGEGMLCSLPYAERIAVLSRHHIGLWDVIASARRQGSLDAAIRDASHQDLVAFGSQLPDLRAIAFNGGTASKRGRKQLAGHENRWGLLDLPSSSAAYANMPRPAKLMIWRSIEQYLG